MEESLEDEDLEIDGVEGSGSSSFPSQRIALKIRKLRKVFSGLLKNPSFKRLLSRVLRGSEV